MKHLQYPIIIPILFLAISFIPVWLIDNTWIEPANQKLIKEKCPNGIEKCGLLIEPSPIFVIIPIGFLVVGLMLGNMARLTA